MKEISESEVTQSCPTLSNPMDCSLPGSSVHGIFQARVLEWVAIAFSSPHHYTTYKQMLSFIAFLYIMFLILLYLYLVDFFGIAIVLFLGISSFFSKIV